MLNFPHKWKAGNGMEDCVEKLLCFVDEKIITKKMIHI